MKKQILYYLSITLFSLPAGAVLNDGTLKIGYRTTLPIAGQTTGKKSVVQVEIETTVLDFDFSRRFTCKTSILAALEKAKNVIAEEKLEEDLFDDRVKELREDIEKARAAVSDAEPESQKKIKEHILLLNKQLNLLILNHNKNYSAIFSAIRSLERMAEADWYRLFETVHSFLRPPGTENVLKAFLLKHQLSSSELDYFLTHFSENCTRSDGVRRSALSDLPLLLPVEIQLRIPTDGLSPVQIRELKIDIVSGKVGGGFKVSGLGYWTHGSEFQDGWNHGFHLGRIEWSPEMTAPIATDLVFKIHTSLDFGVMARGSVGGKYLKVVDPIVHGQAIEVLTRANDTGVPLKRVGSSENLGLPLSITSDGASGFSTGTMTAAKIGISARLWSALEFSLAYAMNYFDTAGGAEEADFNGNFSSFEQSIDASVMIDLTHRFSLGLYSRYDDRTMSTEHSMGNAHPLSIPSQYDRAGQAGGVISIKW